MNWLSFEFLLWCQSNSCEGIALVSFQNFITGKMAELVWEVSGKTGLILNSWKKTLHILCLLPNNNTMLLSMGYQLYICLISYQAAIAAWAIHYISSRPVFAFSPTSFCNVCFIYLFMCLLIYHASSKINLSEEQLKADCDSAMSSHSIFPRRSGKSHYDSHSPAAHLKTYCSSEWLNCSIQIMK